MEAKDVDMNIVFNWISQQEDSYQNKVNSINLFPGSKLYFEICDLSENGQLVKAITFEGETESGFTSRYTIPINEYLQILRDEKLSKIL